LLQVKKEKGLLQLKEEGMSFGTAPKEKRKKVVHHPKAEGSPFWETSEKGDRIARGTPKKPADGNRGKHLPAMAPKRKKTLRKNQVSGKSIKAHYLGGSSL